jgi:6-phosphogluconolactonase (cycloisomerase 2 family)
LTQIATYGIDGQAGYILAFADGTASVAYTPTFAYATNSGSKSITEVSIAEGAFGAVTGSPLTDKNGPKTSVATENHEYFYTGNSNGSISEYKIEATGALAKIKGSPITGLVNSVALGFSPFYNLLYAEDPSADVEDIYSINPTTGVLALSASGSTDGNSPQAIASDPFGQFYLVVNAASAAVGIGIPGTGFVGTVATGANPAAITLDPSSQFVYVANSGDNTVSAYNLTLASPYLTPIGSAVAAGATPSALVAEPYGKYLYVANTGSNTISAYYIDPFAGILTPISGTFTTQSRPSALSVSNDGAYLYVADEGAGLLEQFTINADGTLTNTGSNYGLGTAPSSLTTVGTYK